MVVPAMLERCDGIARRLLRARSSFAGAPLASSYISRAMSSQASRHLALATSLSPSRCIIGVRLYSRISPRFVSARAYLASTPGVLEAS
eukprot:CAMPEP_0196754472 /NCGR_PEP_ID=MMETSP1091-20130531/94040_1 /TAXON_ID=302021 /ORGANISM="Rhodomonas sp., Strain CCMP768" /LENGTH=88 /DNA_ID=CAMNT_0042102735 /DNA_START=65 /DNA_END=327 /DNA_ORIENTATION=+